MRMLIKCQECELQVSDKASTCPHCGYPMKHETPVRKQRTNKRRRLPNGFGQISEIKNRNLRNPFRAMVTVGKTDTGRPICKPLKPNSYFETYNDAYSALVEYNKNPYDLSPAMTLNELFEKWSDDYFKTIVKSSIDNINQAWLYCSQIYTMRVVDVRPRHIRGCMDDGYRIVRGKKRIPTPSIKNQIKSLFNKMLDYAVEYEIVDRNYSRTFKLPDDVIRELSANRKSHMPFTDDEIEILWDNVNSKLYVDAMLIQCYSGWRPNELGLIKIADVDLENWSFKSGSKTQAGRDRIVPIHSKIRGLVVARYNEALSLNSEFLFNCTDIVNRKNSLRFTYDRYNVGFSRICTELGLNTEHRLHDGRTHFVTQAKKCNVDEYAIKYIVGHKINDITEKVYTKREFEWLSDEIEKIK